MIDWPEPSRTARVSAKQAEHQGDRPMKLPLLILAIAPTLVTAAPVLFVNTTNPSSVVITGDTSGLSSATDVDFSLDLRDFFTSSQGNDRFNPPVATGLADVSNGAVVGNDDVGITMGTTLFLDSDADHSFTNGQQAFTGGSLVLNMSSVSGALPGFGATGNVVTFFNGNTIGQWQVVPEPSAFIFLGFMGLGFFAWKKIRRLRS